MFTILWWIILVMSLVFLVIDIAGAKEGDKLFFCGELLTMLSIFLIVSYLMLTFKNSGLTTESQTARIIALVFLLIPVRKLVDTIIYFIAKKNLNDNVNFSQYFEEKGMVSTDTENKKHFSDFFKITYHLRIYIACIVIYMICSIFPGITMSRINVTINAIGNVLQLLTGGTGNQVIFLVWLVSFMIIISASVTHIEKVFNSDDESLLWPNWKILAMFIVRKVFLYIFVMDNYRIQDTLFWLAIIALNYIAYFVYYVIKYERSNPEM